MIRKLPISIIKIYQKYISPKKGYRCAHSILHGGTGCSGAVIEIIQKESVFKWRKKIKNRFLNCKNANIKLKKTNNDKKKKSKCDGSCRHADCTFIDSPFFDCGDIGDCGGCSF